jgi:hypothetical protein
MLPLVLRPTHWHRLALSDDIESQSATQCIGAQDMPTDKAVINLAPEGQPLAVSAGGS